MAPNKISELAAIIHTETQKVDAFLISQSLPTPSFDVSCPARLPLPPLIRESQEAVLEASDELVALMLGPARSIASRPMNSWVAVQAIQRFGLATCFPVTETSSFTEIARLCSLPESDTRRLLRFAMTFYIFHEPSPGIVAHTATSKALAEIPLLGQLAGFLSDEMWPAATRLVDAMEKWPGSEEPTESGFSIAYSTNKSMMDVVARDPKRALQMGGAMSIMHAGPGYSIQYITDNFDWGDAVNGVLVDVGGARGEVSIQIARTFPNMKFVVQDLAEVLNGATVPEDLKGGGRLSFMAHDFFHEQPVKGADVYLLRWILHDWSDKYAVKILRSLTPALKKGSRILISDLCLPPPCTQSPFRNRSSRSYDISMKQIQNAKERDADDWAQLLEYADSRLKLKSILEPRGSTLAIICVIWEGETAFSSNV
ncbi:hypothetical protein HYFRA_00001779 [Hymenoscyphus fraxineus]|uniref:O-methyltransferase C-terminal domain-containing protein n=1 Tax=Hymenoscyphus fraxineus TaxID=746836 RepID=A0A9N9KJF1_9HELO|nr:hypothetical protein HYFRA_00001779 [Hymenoscyphus fraxineus]